MAKLSKAASDIPAALTPLILPSRIEDSERDYLNLLQQQIQSLQSSLQTFGGYLVSKYQIKQGETIKPDGMIVRPESQP